MVKSQIYHLPATSRTRAQVHLKLLNRPSIQPLKPGMLPKSMPRLYRRDLTLKINRIRQVKQFFDRLYVRRPGCFSLVERFWRAGNERGRQEEGVVGGVVCRRVGWVGEVRHAGVFEGKDKVDGDFWRIIFGGCAGEGVFVGCLGEV